LKINHLNYILWHLFQNAKSATYVPQTFRVFLKILRIAINKKILQIIDYAGFIYFLALFKNFKFAPGGE